MTHSFLKTKIQIGNTQGPLDYKLNQTVFHHDDVPAGKRIRKEQIQEWKKSKILDFSRSNWNQSSKPDKLVCERRQMENHVHDRSNVYQYNYRAESLDPLKNVEPIDKSTKFHITRQTPAQQTLLHTLKQQTRANKGYLHRTAEIPNHPTLDESIPWNTSTYAEQKTIDRNLEKITNHAKEWTSKVTNTLPTKTKYISPMESSILLQEKIRQQKYDGVFSTKNDVVRRPISVPIEPKEFKNRYLNEQPNRIQLNEHSGIWEKSRVENK